MVDTTKARKEILKVSKAMIEIGFNRTDVSTFWEQTLKELEMGNYEN